MAQGKPYTEKEREEILKALKQYFTLGYNRHKSCMFIGFDSSTLYKWEEKDHSLSKKIDGWINSVNAKARENIAKEIKQGDKESSKWWLERREKKDWSQRTELEHDASDRLQSIFKKARE